MDERNAGLGRLVGVRLDEREEAVVQIRRLLEDGREVRGRRIPRRVNSQPLAFEILRSSVYRNARSATQT